MYTYPRLRRAIAAMLFGFALVSLSAFGAQALEPAKGKPILKVSGEISTKNDGEKAVFDIDMLEGLEKMSFTTQTPWFEKPVKFEGVLIRDIMKAVGADGEEVVAVALNDYKATVPMDDIENLDVILAYKRDGEYMEIRDKGPLFIVYPYDSKPGLHHQVYYGRSVWQLGQLVVQ